MSDQQQKQKREQKQITVYLAGPYVFYDNAKDFYLKAKAEAQKYNITLLTPLDKDLTSPKEIFKEDLRCATTCDCIIGCLDPHRGKIEDSGTVVELTAAYMKGVYTLGFMEDTRSQIQKNNNCNFDSEYGVNVEDFKLSVNLMVYYICDELIEGDYTTALKFVDEHRFEILEKSSNRNAS